MSNNAIITQQDASYTQEQRKLITDVLCKGATGEEIAFFMQVAQRCRLDPFRKQIHAVHRWDSNLKRMALTFQVGIDGLRAIAARTGEYAGNDEPIFEEAQPLGKYPIKATCTVYRLVHGHRVPFTASVWWDECVQTKKDGGVNSMWSTRPRGQLGKCAEAAALRKAFPEDTSGLYTEEETSIMPLSEPQVERQQPNIKPITQHRAEPVEMEVVGSAPPEHWSELLPVRWKTVLVNGASLNSMSDKDFAATFNSHPDDGSIQRMALDARRYSQLEHAVAAKSMDMSQVEATLINDGNLAEGERIMDIGGDRLPEISDAIKAMLKGVKL
jgi:hypothetical protein